MNFKQVRSRWLWHKPAMASIIAFTLLLNGCITRKTIIPQSQKLLPVQASRSFADLLQLLTARSKAVRTLKSTVRFQPSRGARKKGEVTDLRYSISGLLVINRPDDIRIRFRFLGFTGGDLVSDAHDYRLWSPWNNKFYLGRGLAAEPIEVKGMDLQLPPPRDIARAMFVDVTPYLNNPQKYRSTLRQSVVGQHSYYVVSFVDVSGKEIGAQVVEDVWIDRTSMEIVRQQMYGKDGAVVTDTEFSSYRITDGIAFPQVMIIQRPIEDIDLKITLQSPTLNADLAADTFQLPQPAGAELVQMPASAVKP